MKRIAPLAGWLIFLLLADDALLMEHWEAALVALAALTLVPAGLRLSGIDDGPVYYATAAMFCVAYLQYPGIYAPLWALPYTLLAAWLAMRETAAIATPGKWRLEGWMRWVALVYWATGAVWALSFLAGWRPLDFDAVIVGLTAAHFHVAGFVLTVIACCLLEASVAPPVVRPVALATLLGMPMVAAGITLTKLGYPTGIESAAATGFAVLAFAVAVLQIKLAFQSHFSRPARILWLIGACCLIAGAALAALYALRFYYPSEWANIPFMKRWHGTLNTAGFGLLSLWGWETARGVDR